MNLTVVDRWSLFRSRDKRKNWKQDPKIMFVVNKWLLFGGGRFTQVWLYFFEEDIWLYSMLMILFPVLRRFLLIKKFSIAKSFFSPSQTLPLSFELLSDLRGNKFSCFSSDVKKTKKNTTKKNYIWKGWCGVFPGTYPIIEIKLELVLYDYTFSIHYNQLFDFYFQ